MSHQQQPSVGSEGAWSTFDIMREMWGLLTPSERRRARIVLAVIVGQAFVEFVGVGSILPFLDLLTNPEAVTSNRWLGFAHQLVGAPDTRTFLLLVGLGVLGVILFANAYAAFSTWLQVRFTADLNHALSVRLLESYVSRPYPYFLQTHTSGLSKNLLQDVQKIAGGVVTPGLVLISRGLVTVAIFGLLLAVEPRITLGIATILGVTYGAIYLKIRRRLNRLGTEVVELNEARYKAASETFGGLKDLKLTGRGREFIDRYRAPSEQMFDRSVQHSILSKLPRYLIQAFTFGGLMVVLLILIGQGANLQRIVPIMGLFAFAGYRLLPAFQEIMNSMAQFKFNEHILRIVEEDLSSTDADALQQVDEIEPLSFTNRIRLDGITYTYENAKRPALDGIDVEIVKNTSVAFVGHTGAGKTTLIDLILGLLHPEEGTFLVDDHPVTPDNVRRWQRNIGYVPQEIFLVDDSIARNIAYGVPEDRIDRDAVRRAARTAHIHRFIEQELDDGYDTAVGERGVRLSGGQRQRIGIARALYHDPEVLVFDEATSDIDNVTQSHIAKGIRELDGEKTVIIVAHRLSTIRDCDQIHVLKQGEVLASGTYDALVETSPTFRELAQELSLPTSN